MSNQLGSNIATSSTMEIEVDPELAAQLEAAANQPDTWFKCGSCGEHFSDLGVLLAHLPVHQNEDAPFSEASLVLDVAEQEVTEHDIDISYPCLQCGAVLNSIDLYEAHVNQFHGDQVGRPTDGVAANVVIGADQYEVHLDDSGDRQHPDAQAEERQAARTILARGGPFKIRHLEPLPPEFRPWVALNRLPEPLTKDTIQTLVRQQQFVRAKLPKPPKVKKEKPPKKVKIIACPECEEQFHDQATLRAHISLHRQAAKAAANAAKAAARTPKKEPPAPKPDKRPKPTPQHVASQVKQQRRQPLQQHLQTCFSFDDELITFPDEPDQEYDRRPVLDMKDQLQIQGALQQHHERRMMSHGPHRVVVLQQAVPPPEPPPPQQPHFLNQYAGVNTQPPTRAIFYNDPELTADMDDETRALFEQLAMEDDYFKPVRPSRRKKRICHICGADFANRRNLRRHLVHLHNDLSLENPPPPAADAVNYTLQELEKMAHLEGPEGEMARKILSSNPVNLPTACPLCPARFSQGRNLRRHMRNIHKDPVALALHKPRQHANRRRNEETLEDMLMDFDEYVPVRSTLALAEIPVNCQVCAAKFSNTRNLRRHLQNLHKDMPLNQLLRIHERLAVEGLEKIQEPGFPGFNIEANLATDYDLARCNDEARRPHVCHLCGIRFMLKNTLRRHIKVEHADFMMDNFNRLQRNLPPEELENELPYFIPELGISLPGLSGGLARNKKLNKQRIQQAMQQQGYTGRAPYNSKLQQFNVPGTLPSSGERLRRPAELFTCRLCERQFLTTSGLERHAKTMHPDEADDLMTELQRYAKERHEIAAARGPLPPEPATAAPAVKPLLDHKEALNMEAQIRAGGSRLDGGLQAGGSRPMVPLAGYDILEAPETANGRLYVCSVCHLQLPELPAIESHMRAHQRNEVLRLSLIDEYGEEAVLALTCVQCNVVFRNANVLRNHFEAVHHGRQLFECYICHQTFLDRDEIAEHMSASHRSALSGPTTSNQHECVTCHKKFMTAKSLQDHCVIEKHGADNPKVMKKQDNPTKRLLSANQPAAQESSEMACRATCDFCGTVVPRPSHLIRHMKAEHNRTNFTATVETKGMPPFKIDVHNGKFTWGCCEIVFDDRQAFIDHRRSQHSKQSQLDPLSSALAKENTRCEKCNLQFTDTAALVAHLRTHNVNVISCRFCAISFASNERGREQYENHMLEHKREGVDTRSAEEPLPRRVVVGHSDQEADDQSRGPHSDDEVSVFSDSGVESEADEQKSDAEDSSGLHTCPVCEKKFSCVYRFNDHWALHCRTRTIKQTAKRLKSRPFSYKKRAKWLRCADCKRRFVRPKTFALHRQHCLRLKRGVPSETLQAALLFSDSHGVSIVSEGRSLASPIRSPTLSLTPHSSPQKDSSFLDLRRSPRSESTRSLRGNVSSESSAGNPASSLAAAGDDRRKRPRKPDEVEDTLDIHPKKKRFEPVYVERAYVVAWDTKKQPHENPYTCKACECQCGDFLSLVQHVKTHIPCPITSDAQCDVIDDHNALVQASVIQIKTSSAPSPNPFPCQVCNKRFISQSLLEEHVRTHKPRKSNRCEVCRHRFWKRSALLRHARIHNPTKFHCVPCGKRFKNAEYFKNHQNFHELMNSLYQCEDCSVTFYGLDSLKRHFQAKHSGIKMRNCQICARIHSDSKSLRQHLTAEHPNLKATCLVCGKRFRSPMHVATHVCRVHTLSSRGDNLQSLKCTLCSKHFVSKQALAVHQWRHTCEKPIQCRVCDKGFDSDAACREHLSLHHSIDDAMDQGDHVVDNVMIYGSSDDREELKGLAKCFSCYVCRRLFGSKLSVRTHVSEMHRSSVNEFRHACPDCDVAFAWQFQRVEHMKRRHGYVFASERESAEQRARQPSRDAATYDRQLEEEADEDEEVEPEAMAKTRGSSGRRPGLKQRSAGSSVAASPAKQSKAAAQGGLQPAASRGTRRKDPVDAGAAATTAAVESPRKTRSAVRQSADDRERESDIRIDETNYQELLNA